ncbi:MAG: four helix bundle protein [Saprospiraceae bacterium]|nr:four helix bundle protein [Saprospiraceae bacterium]
MSNEVESSNIILKKCFEFSLAIIQYTEDLEALKKFVIANQLLKSGTSIGANVYEAQDAESKADFLHKIKLAAKELNETEYWLHLCQMSKSYPDCEYLIVELKEMSKIINKILITLKSSK